MPLQLFFADLHSEVPLQEFTPVHFTVAASAANDVVLMTEVNSMAAAAAIAALDILLICIVESSIVIERSGIAAHIKDPANAVIITQLSKLMPVSIQRQNRGSREGRLTAGWTSLNHGFLLILCTNCIRTSDRLE
jgi:hypothetical protein